MLRRSSVLPWCSPLRLAQPARGWDKPAQRHRALLVALVERVTVLTSDADVSYDGVARHRVPAEEMSQPAAPRHAKKAPSPADFARPLSLGAFPLALEKQTLLAS